MHSRLGNQSALRLGPAGRPEVHPRVRLDLRSRLHDPRGNRQQRLPTGYACHQAPVSAVCIPARDAGIYPAAEARCGRDGITCDILREEQAAPYGEGGSGTAVAYC